MRATLDCAAFRERKTGIPVLIPRAYLNDIPPDGRLELEPAEQPEAARHHQPTREERESARNRMMVAISKHPTLLRDFDELAKIAGVHPGTARRWVALEERKFRENLKREQDDD